jgi:hypothetical protein
MRLALVLLLVLPSVALADGGPVTAFQGGTGVTVGADRYVALGLRHRTLIERSTRYGVDSWRAIPGSWGVPGVTFNAGTGLSGDGRTLVLAGITNRYPQRRSRFAVLDAHRLRVRARFALPGFYTVDAVSPHGRFLYFTHYTNARGTDYEVRAYDVAFHHLLRDPIVDRREPDEKMVGIAIDRVSSPDARWAYTLYQRPEGGSFVHALDTTGRRAFCIDLDELRFDDPADVPLSLTGPLLRVGDQAIIDTRSFAVLEPGLPLFTQAAHAARPPAV